MDSASAYHDIESTVPAWVKVVRALALVAIAFAALVLLSVGTAESRLAISIILIFGAFMPRINLYSLALFGPLYLDTSGANSFGMNLVVEALALGTVLGTVLHWRQLRGENQRSFGVFPFLALGVWFFVFAAAFPSLVYAMHDALPPGVENRMRYAVLSAFGGWTEGTIYYGIRGLFNWTLGLSFAACCAVLVTKNVVFRFYVAGVIGLAFACLFGLLDYGMAGWEKPLLSLEELRRSNTDPHQAGRFQGTAGHAGWFGQWTLLVWPGILLLLTVPNRKVKVATALAAGLALLCLILTSARATWVGIAFSVGMLLFVLPLREFITPRKIGAAIGTGTVVLLIGIFAGGEVLRSRFLGFLELAGRENYLSSALTFIREYPFGIGLGQHSMMYGTLFNYRSTKWFQNDFTTSHNFYLNVASEQSLLALLFYGFALGLLCFVALAMLRKLSTESKFIVAACLASIAGLLINGIAQYFFYIHAVEMAFWAIVGILVGLLSSEASDRFPFTSRSRVVGLVILVIAGVCASVMLFFQTQRPLVDAPPRKWVIESGDGTAHLVRWTTPLDRTAIDSDASRIRFTLYRKGLAANVTIRWPDGLVEEFEIPAEGYRVFDRRIQPVEPVGFASRYRPRRFFEIETSPPYTLSRWSPALADHRELGVYVNEFYVWNPWEEGG